MPSATSRLCPVCHTLAPGDTAECASCSYSFPSGPGGDGGPPLLEAGTMLGGRYEILAALGHGGMGMVYRASDHQLAAEVAVKLVLPGLLGAADVVSRFVAEARRARELSHDNIVRVYNLEILDGAPLIAMELLEGEDLKARIGRGPLTLPDTVDIALQVCAGLAYAHAHGFVHRDIKPQNLFLTNDGRVKILDFGIAKGLDREGGGALTLSTQTGVMVGTPAYMPPEQAAPRGDVPLDARADVYSLGVVLYQCLTGRLPFAGQSPVEVAIKQVTEAPPPPRTLRPEIPPELERILLRTLAKDPAERHMDMEALAADLRWLRDEGLEAPTRPLHRRLRPATPPSGPWRPRAVRRPRWTAAAVALAGALLLGAGLLAGPQLVDALGRTPRQRAASFTGVAEVNEEAGRLLPPSRDNAYDEFMKAIRADGTYERARTGLDRILDTHLTAEQRELEELAARLDAFEPGAAGADERAAGIRRGLTSAESELARLRELFFERDEVARFGSEVLALGRRWAELGELDARLRRVDDLIGRGALTAPPGANARDALERIALDFSEEDAAPGLAATRARLVDALVREARATEAAGNPFAALATLETALAVAPGDAEIEAWRDRIATERDRRLAERERIESAGRLVASARTLLAQGALVAPPGNNALELFELALERDPASTEARDGLDDVRDALIAAGRAALDAGRSEEAIERLELARRRSGREEEVAALLARGRERLAEQRRAARRLEEAEELLERADGLAQRGQLATPGEESAASIYRRVLDGYPEAAPRARDGLERVRNRLRELAADAREAGQSPVELGYLQQLAHVAPLSGALEERVLDLERAIEQRERELDREKRIEELLEAARAQLAARRWTLPPGDNAAESFQRVLEIEPDHPDATAGLDEVRARLLGLGDASLERGDLETARAAFRRASSLDTPEAADRLRSVEALLAEERDRAERQRELEARALEERQRLRAEAVALLEEGRSALGEARLADAVDLVEQASTRDVRSPGLKELEQALLGALVDAAQERSEAGELREARELLSVASRIDAAHAGASAMAARIDRRARALDETERARAAVDRDDVEAAVRALEATRELAPELAATERVSEALMTRLEARAAAAGCSELERIDASLARASSVVDAARASALETRLAETRRECRLRARQAEEAFIPPP